MHILVRFTGEMMLKSQAVSKRFQKHLFKNIKQAFKQEAIAASFVLQWSRIEILTEDSRSLDLLKRIFGVYAYSLIEHECSSDLEEVLQEGERLYKEDFKGKSFCVKTHRVGVHPFSSVDVNCKLGSRINSANEISMVKLEGAEKVLHVEVRHEKALFFQNTVKCIGGLPIGSAGRCVSLVSGGFDSCVASWMMQKRGVKLQFLFCNLAGLSNEHSVMKVMSKLLKTWGSGEPAFLNIVDFQPVVSEILKKVKPAFSQVVLKRLFYKLAERLSKETHSHGIVTGEAISQVSTQTIKNLEAISTAVRVPVYRPIISYDKEDIMDLAKTIGVYSECKEIKEYCQIAVQKPVTACHPERAEYEESHVDMSILDTVYESRKVLRLDTVDSYQLSSSYLFKEEIPEEAVVIDCQTDTLYDKFHHPKALHWDFYDLLSEYKSLSKDPTYVLYCTHGTQSVVLAEKMQKDGYEAFSLKGGIKNIQHS